MNSRDARSSIFLCLVAGLTVVGLSCDESLPPRNEPQQYISASLDAIEGNVTIRGGQATSLAGSFLIKLMNEYDEVLQGEARVQVSVSIYYKPNPSLSQTVTYGADDLLNGWLVSSGVLTLGVDTAAVFLRQWSHHTSDGTPFWQFVDLTPRTTAKGEPYLESDPMHFVARASVQVFKNVQPLQTREIEFTLVYDVFQTTL